MANLLLIEKQTGGYFKFVLNGDTANAITSIQNDLLAVGNQLHFKTGNGANIIKEQFIYPEDVTIISGGTFTFTTVAQVWDKLIDIDYFAWLGGGSGIGIDRFDDLVDTFKYTGKAGKVIVVDNSELKLTTITLYNKRLFTELEDTPSSLVPNKMVVVNSTGDALVFQDQPQAPESLLNSVGYFDYNDLITHTTPLTAVSNTPLKLTNDSEGANTSTDQNPYGVSYVWDYTTNQFNFSELSVGDTVDIRVHVQITTTTSNQKVSMSAKFGISSVSEFTNAIYENQFKSSGTHEVSFVAPFYMGSTYITDYPAELYLTTDASATVKVDGWYIRIIRKDINIVTVDYTVPDATTLAKGIVRLAGDLGGTANSPTVPELANKVPTSRTISTTSPLLGGGALGSNLTLSIQQANSTDSGFITFADWNRFDEAHNDRIVSAAVTGTTTKTLTLNQHDGGTVTANWTDDNSVTSVFGRTGAVVATSGDYTTSLVTESTNKNYQTDNQKLYNDATSSIQTQLNSKATDSNVVHLTGNESIAGTKTFTGLAKFTSGTGLFAIEIDVTAVDALVVKDSGTTKLQIGKNGEILGAKYKVSGGSSSQFLKANGDLDSNTYALDSAVVKLTGSQTITGLKTFSNMPILSAASGVNGQIVYADSSNQLKTTTNFKYNDSTGVLTTQLGDLGSNAYTSTAYQPLLTNPVTASTFTANYHAKFTGSGYAIGNSIVWDNGTNVGIGTTSPTEALDVVGAINVSSAIRSSGEIMLRRSGNELRLGSGVGADYSIFYAGGSERMRITSGGNVGIGTTSPDAIFTINKTNTNYTDASAGHILLDNSSSIGQSSIYYRINGTVRGKVRVDQTGTMNYIANGGSHDFWTGGDAGSGSTKMTITSGGNVGIGTTSPSNQLSLGSSVGGVNTGLTLDWTGSGGPYTTAQFTANHSSGEVRIGAVSSNYYTTFYSGNTERMRITSGGAVLVGTTSDTYSSNFISQTSTANVPIGRFNATNGGYYTQLLQISCANTSTNNTYNAIQFAANGTERFVVRDSGNVQNTNNSYGGISDIKLKENIVDTTPKLNDLLKVKVRNYNFIGQESKQLGVIAQELEDIFPSLVDETKDKDDQGNDLGTTTKSVKYSVFVPMLIKAMQELAEQVQELKAEIEILKNK